MKHLLNFIWTVLSTAFLFALVVGVLGTSVAGILCFCGIHISVTGRFFVVPMVSFWAVSMTAFYIRVFTDYAKTKKMLKEIKERQDEIAKKQRNMEL